MTSLSDPAVIRRFLETDRPWAVYALGDLSPKLFPKCSWLCSPDGESSLVLLCHAFGTPVLLTVGEASALTWMLEEKCQYPSLYLHVRPEIVALVQSRYQVLHEKTMWRMILEPESFRPAHAPNVARIGISDLAAVEYLYADGAKTGESPDFFFPPMLEDGVFFGIWEAGELVAAAGTHLVVPTESVAAIGNVYTRRDCRGRGLATRVTSAVATELLRLNLKTVALNVEHKNSAAIRVYERLGFARYCTFHEGLAVNPNRLD